MSATSRSLFLLIVVCLVDLFVIPPASAQTTVDGGTLINQTWTLAGSPYLVRGDVVVPVGSFLHVDPGVEVQIAAGDAQASGTDVARVEIRVAGELRIVGTSADPITVHAETGDAPDLWWGIELEDATPPPAIEHASIEHAAFCVSGLATGLRISDAEFSKCHRALWVRGTADIRRIRVVESLEESISLRGGGPFTLDRVTVLNGGGAAINSQASAGMTLSNCLIQGNTFGIGLSNQTAEIINCTIDSNTVVGVSASVANLTVRNSIITNNGDGVFSGSTASVTVLHSNVWGNTMDAEGPVTLGAGTISANPQYVGAPADLHVLSTSVTIDTGAATGAPDHDIEGNTRPVDGNGIGGAEFDMGAYEFGATSTDGGVSDAGLDAGLGDSGAATDSGPAPDSGARTDADVRDGAAGDGATADGGVTDPTDDGCGCSAPGRANAPPVIWGLLILAGSIRQLRRRRRRTPRA